MFFKKEMGADTDSQSEGLFEGNHNQVGDGMGAIAIRTTLNSLKKQLCHSKLKKIMIRRRIIVFENVRFECVLWYNIVVFHFVIVVTCQQ